MKATNPLYKTTPFCDVSNKGDLETVLDGASGAYLIEQPVSVISELCLYAKSSRNR